MKTERQLAGKEVKDEILCRKQNQRSKVTGTRVGDASADVITFHRHRQKKAALRAEKRLTESLQKKLNETLLATSYTGTKNNI